MIAEAEAPRRTRGRRRKSEASGRDALLTAALSAFAQRGYDGVDLRSIAETAGVDVGLVRVHFGSKEGLWRTSLLHFAQELAPLNARIGKLASGVAPLEHRVEQTLREMVDFAFAHPEFGHFFAQQAAERGERLIALSEHLVAPGFEVLHPLLQEAAAAGVLRASDPVMALSVLVGALTFTTRAPGLIESLEPTAGDLRSRLVKSLLNMLLTDVPPKDDAHVSY